MFLCVRAYVCACVCVMCTCVCARACVCVRTVEMRRSWIKQESVCVCVCVCVCERERERERERRGWGREGGRCTLVKSMVLLCCNTIINSVKYRLGCCTKLYGWVRLRARARVCVCVCVCIYRTLPEIQMITPLISFAAQSTDSRSLIYNPIQSWLNHVSVMIVRGFTTWGREKQNQGK